MHLRPEKLHVTFARQVSPGGPLLPRAYTLTHSDSTGDLFLTVGSAYDRSQISGWYTRLLRDEVLAEWGTDTSEPAGGSGYEAEAPRLTVHCHVSGGIVLGSARWRYGILRGHMPLVIEALRYGDSGLFLAHPELDEARVWVRFHSHRRRYDLYEDWGRIGNYR